MATLLAATVLLVESGVSLALPEVAVRQQTRWMVDRQNAQRAMVERTAMPEAAPTVTPLTERAHNIAIIKRVWGRQWQLGVRIAACESNLQADAYNPTNPDHSEDVGLFQINSIHAQSRQRMLDPGRNAEFAYTLLITFGTAPWESSRHCWSR